MLTRFYIKIVFVFFLLFLSCSEVSIKDEKPNPKKEITLDLSPYYEFERDYKNVKILGEGAFSSVYSAKFTHPTYKGKTLAVKVYKQPSKEDKTPLLEAIHEYNILKKISHPNIPKVYQEAYDKVLMESIDDSRQLTDSVIKNYMFDKLKEKSYDEQIQFFLEKYLELLGIIKYLHSKNIAHLDIAGRNILLQNKNGKEKLYLIDFGKSKIFPDKVDINTDIYRTFQVIYGLFKEKDECLFLKGTKFYDVLTIMQEMLLHTRSNGDYTIKNKTDAIRKLNLLIHKKIPVNYQLINIDALIRDVNLLKEEFVKKERTVPFMEYSFYRHEKNFSTTNNIDFSQYNKYE